MNRKFAKGVAVSSDTRKTHLNNNDVIIGVSGGGKTGSYVVPYIMGTDESFIVSDTKSNLYRRFKSLLKRRGFTVYNIDLIHPECGDGYDPLRFISKVKRGGKMVYSEKDILTVANAICPVRSKKDPFWECQAQEVISMLISYVLDAFDEKDHDLATVADVFRLFSYSVKKRRKVSFLEEHSAAFPDSLAARKYGLIRGSFDADKTWGSTFMFVSTALDVFDFDAAREMSTKPTRFNFEDIGRKKTAVFLNVSDSDRSLDALVNIFYTQAFQSLMRLADRQKDSRLPMPVRVILDDFATNCFIPDFDKLISVIRSREISTSIILQSVSQLDHSYSVPQKWTIINNCDQLLYLGGADLSTVDYIARRARKPVEEIMALPLDKAFFIQRGCPSAMLVEKLEPYADMARLEHTGKGTAEAAAGQAALPQV